MDKKPADVINIIFFCGKAACIGRDFALNAMAYNTRKSIKILEK